MLQQDKPCRVLMADDDESFRQLLPHVLRDCQCDFVIASNGQQALDFYADARASGKPFDLLVLDIGMPPISGLKVAETIRESGDTETKIAFWTGEDSPIVDMRASAVQAAAVWQKSAGATEIPTLIHRLLGVDEECES